MPNGNLRTRLIVSLMSAALLAGCVFFALPRVFTDASKWRTVQGTVVESHTTRDPRSSNLYRRLYLTYEYQVQGKTYRSRRATLWSDPVPGRVRRLADREWPAGTPIEVHYDPIDPSRAVLDPTVSGTHKALTIAATALSGLGLLGAVFGRIRSPS